uniref:Component of oligomeric golgi complex 3 n=1 Tax=Hucho hucho TaxID=62062 RepID=A0A4W5MCR4_9TELE
MTSNLMTYTDHSLRDLTDKEKREKLSQWDRRTDAMAPLTYKQPDSVVDIRAAAETLPIPADMPIEDLCSLTSRALRSPFTTTVPASTEDVLIKGFHMLDLENERIETAQQFFFSWFSKLQTQMDQGEGFSLNQSELVDLSESMQQHLSYFNELENINTSTLEGFIPMLSKLDDCIEYVSSHPNFKDYPVYLAKFQQCLSKAMHFMKTHTVNTMQNLTSQLAKRVGRSPRAVFYYRFLTWYWYTSLLS